MHSYTYIKSQVMFRKSKGATRAPLPIYDISQGRKEEKKEGRREGGRERHTHRQMETERQREREHTNKSILETDWTLCVQGAGGPLFQYHQVGYFFGSF